MNLSKSPYLAAALLLAALFSHPTTADEACVKQVFNHYCLGGAAPSEPPVDDDGTVKVNDNNGGVLLTIKDARIVAVSRDISPADWLSFTDLKVKLVRLYSTATDISDFPLYATSRSSKLNAIRAGRGYAAARWQQNGWAVELDWRSLDAMQLRYELLTDANTSNDVTPINALEGL